MIKVCKNCGFNYEVKPYRAEKSSFCSYDCYWGKSSEIKEKTCSSCRKTLAVGCFSKVGRGWNSNCKECRKKEWRNWARRNDTKNRFRFYEWNAKRNKRDIDINLEEFSRLVENSECYYCGDSENRLGLDRVASDRGYIKGNVVACCRRCNVAKNDMPQKEFINLCHKISKKHDIA